MITTYVKYIVNDLGDSWISHFHNNQINLEGVGQFDLLYLEESTFSLNSNDYQNSSIYIVDKSFKELGWFYSNESDHQFYGFLKESESLLLLTITDHEEQKPLRNFEIFVLEGCRMEYDFYYNLFLNGDLNPFINRVRSLAIKHPEAD